MSNLSSGQFVSYADPAGNEAVGLCLRTSSNKKQDGSTDYYVEVVGPLPISLLSADEVRAFGEEPEADGSQVVDSEAGEVGGIKTATSAKGRGQR